MAAPVYYFFNCDFRYVDLFYLWYYICVIEECPEDILFGPIEVPACERVVIKLMHGTEADN